MVKSVLLNDEVHEILKQKKEELKLKKVSMSLSDIAEMAICAGISNVYIREPYIHNSGE